jgi:large repetitive protein
VTRRLFVPAVVVLAALALAASAAAYWSAPGAGTGAGATGGLDQVTGVVASVAGTVAAGTFDVSWTPVAVPAGVAPAYVVERVAGTATTTICTTTAHTCTLTGVADGAAAYRVTAVLNAWTGAPSAATPTVTVQSAAPVITAGPPAHTTQTKPQFTFSDAPFTAFRCRLDGGAQTACTSPRTYTGLAPGTHTFEVAAMDAYGSLTQAAARTWTIDP